MQWKDISKKIDYLLEELTQVLPEDETNPPRRLSDPEKAADRWVRQYVRSHELRLPSRDVVNVLIARATYAVTFARLAPQQELELPTPKAAEVVEILMIELWHHCFRDKWHRRIAVDQLAFAE